MLNGRKKLGIWLGTVSKLWSVDEDNIVDKEIDPAEISDCRLEEIMVWWVNCRNRAGIVFQLFGARRCYLHNGLLLTCLRKGSRRRRIRRHNITV